MGNLNDSGLQNACPFEHLNRLWVPFIQIWARGAAFTFQICPWQAVLVLQQLFFIFLFLKKNTTIPFQLADKTKEEIYRSALITFPNEILCMAHIRGPGSRSLNQAQRPRGVYVLIEFIRGKKEVKKPHFWSPFSAKWSWQILTRFFSIKKRRTQPTPSKAFIKTTRPAGRGGRWRGWRGENITPTDSFLALRKTWKKSTSIISSLEFVACLTPPHAAGGGSLWRCCGSLYWLWGKNVSVSHAQLTWHFSWSIP